MCNKKHVVPNFDNEKIARILKENYEIEGRISAFVAFEDQNALVIGTNRRYLAR